MGFFNSLKVAQAVEPFDSSDEQQNLPSGVLSSVKKAATAVKSAPTSSAFLPKNVFDVVKKVGGVVGPVAAADNPNQYTVTPQQISLGDTVHRSLPTDMLSRLSLASLKDILKKYEEEGEEVKGYAKGGAVYSMIMDSTRRGEDLPDDQLEALLASLSPEEQDALLARLEEPQEYAFGGAIRRALNRFRGALKRIRSADSSQTSTAEAAAPADSTATTEASSAPPLPQIAQSVPATPYAVNPVQYTLGLTQFRGLPQNMLSKLNARTLFDILGNYQDYPVKFADGGPVMFSIRNRLFGGQNLEKQKEEQAKLATMFQDVGQLLPEDQRAQYYASSGLRDPSLPSQGIFGIRSLASRLGNKGIFGIPSSASRLEGNNPQLPTWMTQSQEPSGFGALGLRALSSLPVFRRVLERTGPQYMVAANPAAREQITQTLGTVNLDYLPAAQRKVLTDYQKTLNDYKARADERQAVADYEELVRSYSTPAATTATPLPETTAVAPSNAYTVTPQNISVGNAQMMPSADLIEFLRKNQMV